MKSPTVHRVATGALMLVVALAGCGRGSGVTNQAKTEEAQARPPTVKTALV